jgi:hypothetical protein
LCLFWVFMDMPNDKEVVIIIFRASSAAQPR